MSQPFDQELMIWKKSKLHVLKECMAITNIRCITKKHKKKKEGLLDDQVKAIFLIMIW